MPESQQVMILATNQAFNSLRSAWGLAFAGYPAQALALVRLAHEWNVVLRFARAYPNDMPGKLMSRRTQTGELAKQLFAEEPELADKFQRMRSSLNPFAHQSDLALNLAIRPDASGVNALNLGPFVDLELLRETGYEVLNCSVLVLAELIRWLGGQNVEWGAKALALYADAAAWMSQARQPR